MSLTREAQNTGHERISSLYVMSAIKAIDSARQFRREVTGEDLLKSHKHRLKGVRVSTKSRKLIWSAAGYLVPGAALDPKTSVRSYWLALSVLLAGVTPRQVKHVEKLIISHGHCFSSEGGAETEEEEESTALWDFEDGGVMARH